MKENFVNSKDSVKVICPYCNQPAVLVGSSTIYPYTQKDYGKFWYCATDNAWVGVHKNSLRFAPLGRLANAELREWKMKAHAAFDPLWKSGKISREAAYKKLEIILGASKSEAHIGKLDVYQCQRIVSFLEGW